MARRRILTFVLLLMVFNISWALTMKTMEENSGEAIQPDSFQGIFGHRMGKGSKPRLLQPPEKSRQAHGDSPAHSSGTPNADQVPKPQNADHRSTPSNADHESRSGSGLHMEYLRPQAENGEDRIPNDEGDETGYRVGHFRSIDCILLRNSRSPSPSESSFCDKFKDSVRRARLSSDLINGNIELMDLLHVPYDVQWSLPTRPHLIVSWSSQAITDMYKYVSTDATQLLEKSMACSTTNGEMAKIRAKFDFYDELLETMEAALSNQFTVNGGQKLSFPRPWKKCQKNEPNPGP